MEKEKLKFIIDGVIYFAGVWIIVSLAVMFIRALLH